MNKRHIKKDPMAELSATKKENERLKKEIDRLHANQRNLDELIKECESVKKRFEEAASEANEAKNNFMKLYRELLLNSKK